MKQTVWMLLSGGVILAGCQSSPFQTAKRDSVQPSADSDRRSSSGDRDKGQSPADDRGRASLFASQLGAGPLRKPTRLNETSRREREPNRNATAPDKRADFLRAIARDPDNASAHHDLAILADQSGDFRTAAEHYRIALRLKPDDPDLLGDIGYSNLLQRNYTESERYLQQAYRLSPNNARVNANLGALYAQQGDADRAYDHFRRAGGDNYARAMMKDMFRGSARPTESQMAGSPRRNGTSEFQAPDPSTGNRPSTGFGSRDERFGQTAPNEPTRILAEQMRQAGAQGLARRAVDDRDPKRETRSPYSFTNHVNGMPRENRRESSYDSRNDGRGRNSHFPPASVPNDQLKEKLRQIELGNDRLGTPVRHAGNMLPDWNDGRSDDRNPSRPADDSRRNSRLSGSEQDNPRERELGRLPAAPGSTLWPPDGRNEESFGTPNRPVSTPRVLYGPNDDPEKQRRGQSPQYRPDNRRQDDERSSSLGSADQGRVDPTQREALRMAHNTGSAIPFPLPERQAPLPRNSGISTPGGTQAPNATYTRFDRTGTVTRSAGYRDHRTNEFDRSRQPEPDASDRLRRPDDRHQDMRGGSGSRDASPEMSIQPRTKRGNSYSPAGNEPGDWQP